MSWSEETITELTKLWDAGFSTSEIGRRIGVSKNAVVGKAHRLGLISRPSPIKRIPLPPPPKMVAIGGRACSWPIGDPRKPDFRFCNSPAMPGKPYCHEHAAVAYVAPKSRSNSTEDAA
ncbi:MAG: global cell cycle regulator GcrA-like protein [Rhodospirillales bacterium]|nr:global cell cycle regulator GcrA-like protein [Rhodospirillales bacterium]